MNKGSGWPLVDLFFTYLLSFTICDNLFLLYNPAQYLILLRPEQQKFYKDNIE